MSWYRAAVIGALALFAAACGFQPMYGGGSRGESAVQLAEISVDLIEDRVGQEVRNRLIDRLVGSSSRGRKPVYALSVTLDESISELSVQKTQIASRANFSLTAHFSLRLLENSASVYSGSSLATSSFDILKSEFATTISRQDARSRAAMVIADDIISRLGVYFVQLNNKNGTNGT